MFTAAPAAENVYFGNLHSHTSYSDGSGTPAQAFAYARDKGKMDFLLISEHNHAQAESGAHERKDGLLIATNHDLYDGADGKSLVSASVKFTSDGSFVALYGQEFSTISSGNHMNVFDAQKVIEVPNGAFDKLVDWVHANPDSEGNPPLLQFNHPWSSGEPEQGQGIRPGRFRLARGLGRRARSARWLHRGADRPGALRREGRAVG